MKCTCGHKIHDHFGGQQFCMEHGCSCDELRITVRDLDPGEIFVEQWYQSNESTVSHEAHTDADGPWESGDSYKQWKKAVKQCRHYDEAGHFKTTRVVIVDIGDYTDVREVVWESNRHWDVVIDGVPA